MFEWIPTTTDFMFGEIRQDPLIKEWATLPIIHTINHGYLSCLEIQKIVQNGEIIELELSGYDEILHNCVYGLIQLYLSAILSEKVLTVINRDSYAIQDSHDLFPPLFFIPYNQSNLLGWIPEKEYQKGKYPINERHPFSEWFIANAIELQETVPGLFDLFYAGLLNKSVDTLNKGMQRLIEINHKTVPKKQIIITEADFGRE